MPSNHWLDELKADLADLDARGLRRRLRAVSHDGPCVVVDGKRLTNLAGNDYLALASHPRLIQASRDTAERHGVGAGASRLVSGHLPIHEELERRFAEFKHAQAALLLPTGYAANLAVFSALARPGDLVCLDKLNHASLIDAARASGAQVRTYPHLGLDKLARLLARHRDAPRRFIVTDSVFSMDGDTADLPALCDLADKHDAILVIDEAHGTGVLGAAGAGLAELQHVADRVDITMSTASKALGSLGGIVTAKRVVIDTIVNRARPFIYSTAVPPSQSAAIAAALEVVRDEPWRRQRLLSLSRRLRDALLPLGVLPGPLGEKAVTTPILPVVVGTTERALDLSKHLESAGFLAPAIRPPTVAPGAARVRVSLRADLDETELDRLVTALSEWLRVHGDGGSPTRLA